MHRTLESPQFEGNGNKLGELKKSKQAESRELSQGHLTESEEDTAGDATTSACSSPAQLHMWSLVGFLCITVALYYCLRSENCTGVSDWLNRSHVSPTSRDKKKCLPLFCLPWWETDLSS